MRHLTSLKEQSAVEILSIVSCAQELKVRPRREQLSLLEGRTLIMLFQKTSTRTRLSFEAAMTELGGHAIFLDGRTSNIMLADFQDEIRAIMGMGDALMFRAMRYADVASAVFMDVVPVIDGCSEKYHPCQALGDILTMAEHVGGIEEIKKIAWLGIENNVSNTLALAAAKLGIDVYIAAPERDASSIDESLDAELEKTGRVFRVSDMEEALNGARFVHTDTWMNMEFFSPDGSVKDEHRAEYERRKKNLLPYQINQKLLKQYVHPYVMHCMPCHVGYEITREVIDSPRSLIFDQAENRKHIQKAILLWLMGNID